MTAQTAEKNQVTQPAEPRGGAVAVFQPPRLPWHPAIEERFGVDKASWKALVEAVWPAAKTTDAVALALSYCKARRLDPFKRVVHIVPVWDSEKRQTVETVWPGIAEHRTTAMRTKLYGGADATDFGPTVEQTFRGDTKQGPKVVTMKYPEWCQMTVYRMVDGVRMAVPGPRVYWLETYSRSGRNDLPNEMWQKRPFGQVEKCAEAAALRRAFPEELGDEPTVEEIGLLHKGDGARDVTPARPARADVDHAEEADGPERPATFEFVDIDGVAVDYEDPADFINRFCDEIEANKADGATLDKVWADNSPVLTKVREIDADLAERPHEAITAAKAALEQKAAKAKGWTFADAKGKRRTVTTEADFVAAMTAAIKGEGFAPPAIKALWSGNAEMLARLDVSGPEAHASLHKAAVDNGLEE